MDYRCEALTRLVIDAATGFEFHGVDRDDCGFWVRVSRDTDESEECRWVIHRFHERPWYRIAGREFPFQKPAVLCEHSSPEIKGLFWAPWHPEAALPGDDSWLPIGYENLYEAVAHALRICQGDVLVPDPPDSEENE